MLNDSTLVGEPQMVLIEDEAQTAHFIANKLDIREFVSSFSFIDDMADLVSFLNIPNPIRIFWVDLNLGPGRENDGILMIREIRSRNTNAFIIVFSAYGFKKASSIKAGADVFFIKQEIEETLKKAELLIIEYVLKTSKNISVKEFFAQIAHVDKRQGFVKLDCLIDGQLVESLQPLNRIASSISGPVLIDLLLKVKIVEFSNKIKISFNQVSELPSNVKAFDTEDDKENDDELMKSEMWNDKL